MNLIIKFTLSILCILQLVGCNSSKILVYKRPEGLKNEGESIFNQKLVSIDGKETIELSKFKGKKIIILNVASKCGYTDQYADWEKFFRENKEKVVVLGFPSNEFLFQEKGSNSEIAQFCKLNYDVTFPMFEKTTVKGKDKSPLFQWLSNPLKNGWNKQEPSWNFCKYVINEEGKLIGFFSSKVTPDNEEFRKVM